MKTKILFIGEINAIARKNYEGAETVKAQFFNKKEDGGIEIQEVKMTDPADIASIKEGQTVKIPVKISSYQNKIYFTQIDPMVK